MLDYEFYKNSIVNKKEHKLIDFPLKKLQYHLIVNYDLCLYPEFRFHISSIKSTWRATCVSGCEFCLIFESISYSMDDDHG